VASLSLAGILSTEKYLFLYFLGRGLSAQETEYVGCRSFRDPPRKKRKDLVVLVTTIGYTKASTL
jgi:hypothetical protein